MKRVLCIVLCLLLLSGAALAGFDVNLDVNHDRVVELKTDPPTSLVQQAYQWDLVDGDGNVLVEHMLDELGAFHDGVAVVRKGGSYGYLKEDGSFLVELKLDSAAKFYDGLAMAELDGKKGFIDLNGAWAIEPVYDFANNFNGGYAAVGMRGALLGEDESSSGPEYEQFWGLIDTKGNVLLPLEYDSVYYDNATTVAEAWTQDSVHYFQIENGAAKEIRQVGTELTLEEYMPNAGEKVAVLEEEADIAWKEDAPLPNLDGATALLPVYSALAQATYPDVLRYGEENAAPVLTCTKTNRAYERLIEGGADVIFCAQPSKAQIEMAAEAGVEFELTPFGKEAFVFIVNRDNPIEGLTVAQIRSIYSGEITQWDEVGVEGIGSIAAYQRPANSGSQTAMEALMGDVPLMNPYGQVEDFMGGMIDAIEYRNSSDALGYTFRFFCTDMVGSDVKLLAIDGVAPTVENIRAGRYPVTSTLYAVSRKGETNPNVQIFLDWVQGPQGQALVEKSGYVGK